MKTSQPLFIVNPKSGGHRGQSLFQYLRKKVGPETVFDLTAINLEETLRARRAGSDVVVACGGDGTVAAVLEATRVIDASWPVGIIPLGTGNDLARVAGMPLADDIEASVAAVRAATPVAVDRWFVRGPRMNQAWYNYCSWGADARIAGRFHAWRQAHRSVFRSRLANQCGYALAGLEDTNRCLAVHVATTNRQQPLAAWARSVVVLNIPSYAGGRSLGRGICASDGLCDVVALGGTVSVGLALSGVRRPRRTAQTAELSVFLVQPSFVQLDGEPLPAPAGRYHVWREGQVTVLAAVGSALAL